MTQRRRYKRRWGQIIASELNVLPLMNLFIVLIPLLLLSAVFIEIAVIEMNQSSADEEQQEPLEESLALREEHYGTDSAEVAFVVADLGGSAIAEGHYREALALIQRAIAVGERLGWHELDGVPEPERQRRLEWTAARRMQEADAFFNQGLAAEAEGAIREAISAAEEMSPPTSILSRAYLVLGTQLFDGGDYEEAERVLLGARAFQREIASRGSFDELRIQTRIATMLGQ